MTDSTTVDGRSRYLVGIDLGTTNSAVAYLDTYQPDRHISVLLVPQLVATGKVESRETLPSFLYQPTQAELAGGGLRLPWRKDDSRPIVGVLARELSKLAPGRGTESAKSWLCHSGVDRTAQLLPWQSSEDVTRYSPVEVSAAYLAHIREAWDHVHPQSPLAEQDIVLTLPASFDEIARELTIQAARQAGLPKVVLLEEPQAAFYDWIERHEDAWDRQVSPGQTILVCDVGGGTTDFTLIRVRRQSDGAIQFHRAAVGEHLILGGDNFDLTLAQYVEQELLSDRTLEPRQWKSLVRVCRQAKEILLSEPAPAKYSLSIPGSGTKLIGGAIQVELDRDEVRQRLLDGFFPPDSVEARPLTKKSGFQEFGLPYAADAGITRHLAQFLRTHRHSGLDEGNADKDYADKNQVAARPDIVLFNGGVFISPLAQQRVVQRLESWFGGDEAGWSPVVLENPRHDLAVAQGAAYYGLVRRGEGVRISAGLARTYYVGVGSSSESTQQASPGNAICLMPAGAEPGSEVQLETPVFELQVAAPVEFQLYYSGTRLTDKPGAIVPVEPTQLTALPPIRTVLRQRKSRETSVVAVQVQAALDEIGLLQVGCQQVDGRERWQLQFDVRTATQTDQSAHQGAGEASGVFDQSSLDECHELLRQVFVSGETKPGGLPKRIAEILELPREQWPPTLLRTLWSDLIEMEPGRNRSPEHEARWLNLLGFALRPGFGVALDDWRVAQTWKQLRGKLMHPSPQCLSEWWILWRRIAAGLTSGQQQALATPLLTGLKEKLRKAQSRQGKGAVTGNSHEEGESWRMLGSLEQLPVAFKIELGRIAVNLLEQEGTQAIAPALLWAAGRLGARQPFHGPLNAVVPAHEVIPWIDVLSTSAHDQASVAFALTQLARRTGDRFRDLPESKRTQVIRWLERHRAEEPFVQLVRDGGELTQSDRSQVFGEALPPGLRIRD